MRTPDIQSNDIVVKVGGSLYDLPDLGPRLQRWICELDTRSILIVPGGGATADAVRDLDRIHGLGEETAHWLALCATKLNAHFIQALLPDAVIVNHPDVWRRDRIAVLDAHAFARADEGRAGGLPHRWAVTSDSLAARAAHVAEARRLVLLKSVTIPENMDWHEAGRRGYVDSYFAMAVGEGLGVRSVNFREY